MQWGTSLKKVSHISKHNIRSIFFFLEFCFIFLQFGKREGEGNVPHDDSSSPLFLSREPDLMLQQGIFPAHQTKWAGEIFAKTKKAKISKNKRKKRKKRLKIRGVYCESNGNPNCSLFFC